MILTLHFFDYDKCGLFPPLPLSPLPPFTKVLSCSLQADYKFEFAALTSTSEIHISTVENNG